MSYIVKAEPMEARAIAVVRRRAAPSQLSHAVPKACGDVWSFLRARHIAGAGRHVAVYLDGAVNFECGAEAPPGFAGEGEIALSATPAGLVAHTRHVGPYSMLGEAHAAVRGWCAANGQTPSGPNWDIYGHWTEETVEPTTDVFYLLRS